MKQRRVSIKDVAEAAGVHFSTVSLALREHPRIPEATRQRIVEVANRIGYERSEVARSLVSFRKGVASEVNAVPSMVYVTNQVGRREFQNRTHLREFFEGARSRAEAMGYGFEQLFLKEDVKSREELASWLEEKHVRGVILGAIEAPFDEALLDWSRFAVVKIDSRFIRPRATVVANDQQYAVRLAFREMRSLGYRRIGVAVGLVDHESTHGLYAGGYMLEQHLDSDSEYVPVLYLEKNSSVEGHAAQLSEWIAANEVDAVLCTWSNTPELLAIRGIEVPADVAYANLCLNEPNALRAGVLQNHYRVGQKAAETLARFIKSLESGLSEEPPLIYIPGSWQAGESAPMCKGVKG